MINNQSFCYNLKDQINKRYSLGNKQVFKLSKTKSMYGQNKIRIKTLSLNKTIGNIWLKEINDIVSNTFSYSQTPKKQCHFQVIQKQQDQKIIEQKLEELKNDKIKSMIIKNKIKQRFWKNKKETETTNITTINPEKIYCSRQTSPLQKAPYYRTYTSFFSSTKDKVLHEQCHINKIKNEQQSHQKKQSQISFLKYATDRNHQKKFKQSSRCKTLGSVNILINKQKILQLAKHGSNQHRIISQSLENALSRI